MHDDIPPDEAAEFSRAFDLYVKLDEAKADAERLRAAAGRTTGLEREANIRQAAEAGAEVARIEAALRGEESAEADQGDTAPAKPEHRARTRRRLDDMQIEIDDAMAVLRREGKAVTPATVMPLLRARAGKSCISECAPDGVIWIRGSSGNPEKLTMEALKKRIGRT